MPTYRYRCGDIDIDLYICGDIDIDLYICGDIDIDIPTYDSTPRPLRCIYLRAGFRQNMYHSVIVIGGGDSDRDVWEYDSDRACDSDRRG